MTKKTSFIRVTWKSMLGFPPRPHFNAHAGTKNVLMYIEHCFLDVGLKVSVGSL